MASKIYIFDNPAEFTYDSDKIEIVDGIVKLKEDLTNVYARYHLNEATGETVLDSSGNGRNGTPVNSPPSVTGKLNNCLSFNGSNQYVDCGDIANFERTQSFSIEFWMNTSYTGGWQTPIARMSTIVRGWQSILDITGKIWFGLYNTGGGANALVMSTNEENFNNGIWYHVIITYNGSNTPTGIHIYINGDNKELITQTNNLTATIINPTNCQISGRSEMVQLFDGKLDEVLIYNKELTQSEVTYRYNSGNGRENWYYPIDKPTIKPTTSWEQSGLSSFSKFLETLGGGNQGQLAYQLSDDEGVNWRYWDGNNWVISESLYNTAQIVNSAIGNFSITNEKVMFRAFLISDGSQQCELDTIELNSVVGNPPYVECGSDRECYDHENIKPFYYAIINDPDGDIDNASAYYKIESETWENIPKGGYATLQEAIRNLTYTFDNIGDIECRLKIIDEQAKASEDYLIMTVKKYTVTFNIKDKDGNHLPNLQVSFGDGTDWIAKNSPFIYDYEWTSGTYKAILDKVGFQTKNVYVESTVHTENVTLNILGAVSPSEVADAVWDELRSGHVISGSFGEAIQEELTNIKSETDKIQPEIVDKKAEFKANVTKLDTIEILIKRILGLNQENYKLEDIVYASVQLQVAKIKIYSDSSFNTLIATYQITCTFNPDGTYKTYEVKKL